MLLRRLLGRVLRRRRLAQGRTLRQVADDAKVSVTYLSEVERGVKEASSEVVGAIGAALGLTLEELLRDAVLDLRSASGGARSGVVAVPGSLAPPPGVSRPVVSEERVVGRRPAGRPVLSAAA